MEGSKKLHEAKRVSVAVMMYTAVYHSPCHFVIS